MGRGGIPERGLVSSALRWGPIGPGMSSGIDWSRLSERGRTDPYLCWWDLRGRLASLAPGQALPVLLELREGVSVAGALQRLAASGLQVPPVYGTQPSTRYLTASLHEPVMLSWLQAQVDRSDGFVRRFEASGAAIDRRPTPPAMPRVADGPGQLAELIGFIDFGCAFAHRRFRRADGKGTRIRALWNQMTEQTPRPPAPHRPARWHRPAHLGYGRQMLDGDIDDYVAGFTRRGRVDEEGCYRWAGYAALRRRVAHGTHVMDIAAGGPPTPGRDGPEGGPALAFVQLPQATGERPSPGVLEPHVLDGLRYLESLLAPGARAVFNLSYGGYGGPHDGSTMLERAMDELVRRHRQGAEPAVQIVIAAGNAADRGLHAQARLAVGQREVLSWNTLPDDRSDSFVELWLPEGADVELDVTPPAGGPASPPLRRGEAVACRDRQGRVVAALVAACQVSQGEPGTMLLLASAPTDGSAGARAGRWSIGLRNIGTSPLVVDAWCERDEPPFGIEGDPQQAFFSSHVVRSGSCNAIGHGQETLVVGGLDLQREPGRVSTQAPGPGMSAPYSGTGPGRGLPGRLRHAPQPGTPARNAPDLLARSSDGDGLIGVPGAAVLGADTVRLEGTSVAAARATRWIVEHDFKSPPRWQAGADLVVPPAADGEHPDRGLQVPRLP